MSVRLKQAMVMYHHQVQKNLEAFKAIMSVERNNYKKLRRVKIMNILRLQQKRNSMVQTLLARRGKRRLWTKDRTSTFWEIDMVENGDEFFKENLRMSRNTFKLLCSKLKVLQKQDTILRKCIPLEKRIAIALYTLGPSAEYRKVASLFGVSKATVCNCLNIFCQEVWDVLSPIYLNTNALTDQSIEENVNGFEKLGFPQCLGAMDGYHIEVRKADAVHHNCNGWFSSVLLAVVDYRHRFLYINVGSPGSYNDSDIFDKSDLKNQYQQNIIFKNKSRNICGVDVPVVLIGDSAFQLSDIVMTPYTCSTTTDSTKEKVQFNKVLSKCQKVVENAFVLLKPRFRRLNKALENNIDNASRIVKACCVLHNFCVANNDSINNDWLKSNEDNPRQKQPEYTAQSNDYNDSAERMRNAISRYISDLDVDGSSFGVGDGHLIDESAMSDTYTSDGLGETEVLLPDPIDCEDPLND